MTPPAELQLTPTLATALHEAGHACMALRLGSAVERVELRPPDRPAAVGGCVVRPAPGLTADLSALAYILVRVAGDEAAKAFGGRPGEGVDDDMQDAGRAAVALFHDCDDPQEPAFRTIMALRVVAAELVRRPETTREVATLAAALAKAGRLTGDDVRGWVDAAR